MSGLDLSVLVKFIVVLCGIGVMVVIVVFGLYECGVEVVVYDGFWIEYGVDV